MHSTPKNKFPTSVRIFHQAASKFPTAILLRSRVQRVQNARLVSQTNRRTMCICVCVCVPRGKSYRRNSLRTLPFLSYLLTYFLSFFLCFRLRSLLILNSFIFFRGGGHFLAGGNSRLNISDLADKQETREFVLGKLNGDLNRVSPLLHFWLFIFFSFSLSFFSFSFLRIDFEVLSNWKCSIRKPQSNGLSSCFFCSILENVFWIFGNFDVSYDVTILD